ncbi:MULTISPECIES: HNH endonuclease [Flavobacterium]|uniref:HNH endonuclease n=1 Tax=Flavobacterium hankyongi TaxID=1176532 RepID=A0ABP9A301_9FLAO|nr:HNH endonuclease [Flavobacterium sp. N1846]
MYLKRYFDEEIWKEVELKSPFKEKHKVFVSNYGNLRKINLDTNTEISIKQALTEGYPSFGLSVFTEQSENDKVYLSETRQAIAAIRNEIRALNKKLKQCDGKNADYYRISKEIDSKEDLLYSSKKSYQKKYRKIENARRKNFGALTHRLVALNFIEQPTEKHSFVAHLDFDKLNNHHSNLKWMTSEENIKHQQNSPYVIKAKAIANINRSGRITRSKLSIHQVMMIKKKINEDVPLRKLAKRYNVSETQLLRIKRGINWANIAPAR